MSAANLRVLKPSTVGGAGGAVQDTLSSWAIAVSADHCFGAGSFAAEVLQHHLAARVRVSAITTGRADGVPGDDNGPLHPSLDVLCAPADLSQGPETTASQRRIVRQLVATSTAVPAGDLLRRRWRLGQTEVSLSARRRALATAAAASAKNQGDGGVRLLFCAVRLTADVIATPPDLSLSALGGSESARATSTTATAAHASKSGGTGASKPIDAVQTIAAQALRASTRAVRSPIVELLLRLSGSPTMTDSSAASQRTSPSCGCFDVLSVKTVPEPLSAVVIAELKRGATQVGVEYGGARKADGGAVGDAGADSGTAGASHTLVLLLKTTSKGDDAADLVGLLETFRATARHAWAHGSPNGSFGTCGSSLLCGFMSMGGSRVPVAWILCGV